MSQNAHKKTALFNEGPYRYGVDIPEDKEETSRKELIEENKKLKSIIADIVFGEGIQSNPEPDKYEYSTWHYKLTFSRDDIIKIEELKHDHEDGEICPF